MRVRDILREALTVYERPSDAEIANRIRELLEQVSLKDSSSRTFPRSFPAARSAGWGSRACSRCARA